MASISNNTKKPNTFEIIAPDGKIGGFTEEAIQRIATLTIPNHPEYVEHANLTPESFFKPLEKHLGTENFNRFLQSFNREHVEYAQKMIRRHLIGAGVGWYDLLGIEAQTFLNDSLRDCQDRDALIAKWNNIYFNGYISLLSESVYAKDSYKGVFIKPVDYTKHILKFFKNVTTSLQNSYEIQKQNKPPQVEKIYESLLKTKLDRLQMLQHFFLAFFTSKNPRDCLSTVTLTEFQNSHYMHPQSSKDLQKSIDSIIRYVFLMKDFYSNTQKFIHSFDEILITLEKLKQSPKDLNLYAEVQKILSRIQDKFQQQIFALKNGLEIQQALSASANSTGIKMTIAEIIAGHLAAGWIRDLNHIIEVNIRVVNPKYRIQNDYFFRIFANIKGANEILARRMSDEDFEYPKNYKTIKNLEFTLLYSFFQNNEDIIASIEKVQETAPGYNPTFNRGYMFMKKTLEEFLKNYGTYLQEIANQTPNFSYTLEQTQIYARFNLLLRDIQTLLEPSLQDEDSEIFPQAYLDHLTIDVETSSESDEESLSIPADSPSTTPSSSHSDYSPSITPVLSAASPILPDAAAPPSPQTQSSPKPTSLIRAEARNYQGHRFTFIPNRSQRAADSQASAEALRTVKNRRKANQIMKELGFRTIRTKGSHRVMQDASGRQTVVPNHPEIARGTRRAIERQIDDDSK